MKPEKIWIGKTYTLNLELFKKYFKNATKTMNQGLISGNVSDAELCRPLSKVRILMVDKNQRILGHFETNENGNWFLSDIEKIHSLIFKKNGFFEKKFFIKSVPQKVRLLENRLIGYQEKLWFLPGEKVRLFVNSDAFFIAKLYRHGYRKDLIAELGTFKLQKQLVPDDEFVSEGLSWDLTTAYKIPTHAKPGLYSLLLHSPKKEEFAIPFIVSTPPKSYGQNSKILVLASTNTWQSYNIWGGRSRYRNFENQKTAEFTKLKPKLFYTLKNLRNKYIDDDKWAKLLKKFKIQQKHESWMFKRLTIRRPFTNCSLEEPDPLRPFTNHLAAGEWRLLAWLEREGYEYDIVSGFELHSSPEILSHYKCIILNTHCEYWTEQMFRGLKSFHEESNGWILNISGNSIFREIEFFEDGSTRCVSLRFSESCADEADLLGVRFTMSDYNTCAPYRITDPNHWVFKGIPLSKTITFGGMSLNQNTPKEKPGYDPGRPGIKNLLDGIGASGWETDKLCKPQKNGFKVLAKGLNKRRGADMVIREPVENRGGMFSASSVLFSGCLLIDNTASTIINNLLRRILNDN